MRKGAGLRQRGAVDLLFHHRGELPPADELRASAQEAVEAAGMPRRAVRVVTSIWADDGRLHPLQEAFRDQHALQCGYCTPGFLMAAKSLLEDHPNPTEAEIRKRKGFRGVDAWRNEHRERIDAPG